VIDVVDPVTRSRMMSGIRSKNTRPEVSLRKELHRRGFRFRLHAPGVPGKPDMVLPKFRAAVFVHGCFWHGHDCKYFKMPRTRPEFWSAKIAQNRSRDLVVREMLSKSGWRQLIVWECAVRDKTPMQRARIADTIATWLHGKQRLKVIRSR